MGQEKEDRKWDSTKIVDDSLLIERSSFPPVLKLFSKILFGILLSSIVLIATSCSQVGYLILFQGLSDECTNCTFSKQEAIKPLFYIFICSDYYNPR